MATTVFDTLSFSRKLTDAGMEQRQAEALAGAVHDAVAGSVVTQPAMEHSLDKVKAELDKVKSELRLEIQAVRAGLMTVQWMTGAIVAGVLALVAKSFF